MEPPMKRKNDMDPFQHLFEMMNQFLDDRPLQKFLETVDHYFQQTIHSSTIPITIHETQREYIITAALPNIKPDQIELEFMDRHLVLSVKNFEDTELIDEQAFSYKRQQLRQHMKRTIPLPYPVSQNEIKAAYENGNLVIRLPQKRKYIEIEKRG